MSANRNELTEFSYFLAVAGIAASRAPPWNSGSAPPRSATPSKAWNHVPVFDCSTGPIAA